MAKDAKQKNLVGVGGWLLWFVIGLFVAVGITAFNFFYDGFFSSSDIDDFNSYQAGLGDSLNTFSTLENIGMVIYICLLVSSIVLILRKRKLAKPIVITTLIFGVLYNSIDYAVAASIFSTSDIFQNPDTQAAMSQTANYVGRAVIAAAIWIPYFFVSKRVKATLTK